MKDEVIPRLQQGRMVYAYIEGLNHEKIAEAASMSVERVRELLRPLTREQVPQVHRHVTNDALVILDEAQNFWPTGRQKLDDDMTKFVTEHGHRGLDIVLMGQSMKDVHPLWRRRVESKIYFLKKSALGAANKFSATFYRVIPKGDDVAYESIMTKDYQYEEKYFGTYASHTDGTKNKETYVDPRGVIWNHPLFRRWLPLALLVFLGLGYYVWGLFHGGLESSINKKIAPAPVANTQVASNVVLGGAVAAPAAPSVVSRVAAVVEPKEPLDYVEDLNSRARVRLVGFVRVGSITKGWIEWRDASNNLVDNLSFLDLAGLGYVVMVNQTGTVASLRKGPTMITAVSWPIDKAMGRTSETVQASVSGVAVPSGYNPPVVSPLAMASPQGLTVTGGGR